MTRLELYKQRLKAARAELRMRQKQYNSSVRYLNKVLKTIHETEKKIDKYLAKP